MNWIFWRPIAEEKVWLSDECIDSVMLTTLQYRSRWNGIPRDFFPEIIGTVRRLVRATASCSTDRLIDIIAEQVEAYEARFPTREWSEQIAPLVIGIA